MPETTKIEDLGFDEVLNLEQQDIKTPSFESAVGQIIGSSSGEEIPFVGAFSLGDGINTSGQIKLNLAEGKGDCYIAAGKTDFTNTDNGFILGIDDSDGNKVKMYLGNSTDYLNWDGSNLTISGTLTASVLKYGKTSFSDNTNAGYYISTDGIYAGAASDVNYLKYDISAGTFKLSGLTIDTPTITNIQAGSEISIQGWQQDMTFSATDADTVAWTSGTITLLDGTTYSIDAGNTGNMTALTYIYLDINVSETALQTTTTASTAVGSGKILVAVAQDNSGSDATFQVYGGKGGILVKADNIASNTITANEIASNTITATEMNVSILSAITANMGTITAGSIYSGLFSTNVSGSTGKRITISNSDNTLRFYDASNNQVVGLGTTANEHLLIESVTDIISMKVSNAATTQLTVSELALFSVQKTDSSASTIGASNAGTGHIFKGSHTGTGSGLKITHTGTAPSPTIDISQNDLTNPICRLTTTASDQSVLDCLEIYRLGGGLGVNNQGAAIIFTGRDTANNKEEIGSIDFAFTNQTDGLEATKMGIYLLENNKLEIYSSGNIILGRQAALGTAETDNFVYIPTMAGAPTGTPTSYTGKVAMVYDTTNDDFYIYNGAWKKVALT